MIVNYKGVLVYMMRFDKVGRHAGSGLDRTRKRSTCVLAFSL
jgi:hypothetical protein